MKKLLVVVAFLFWPLISPAAVLLDASQDNELAVTSNADFYEIGIEAFSFATTEPNQEVTVSAHVPFTVHQNTAGSQNGAFRLYLDGTAFDAAGGKQWNGELIGNGGAWCFQAGLPTDGRLSVVKRIVIPAPGVHVLWLMYSGSTTYTIGTLRSRRAYQVY